jgi:predicted DNA-binding transcriptional regulator AlpA
MQKAFYNIGEMAAILGLTVAAIYGHLTRKNFAAVPPPVYLGRRLAWPVEVTDAWVQEKISVATAKAQATQAAQNGPRRVGRPTKAEAKARR